MGKFGHMRWGMDKKLKIIKDKMKFKFLKIKIIF